MQKRFSNKTIEILRPIIEQIYMLLEYHLNKYPDYEEDQKFGVALLEKKGYTFIDITAAISIVSNWLNPADFEVEGFSFKKRTRSAKWSKLLTIIKKNLLIEKTIIEENKILIERTGKVSVSIGGKKLSCDFDPKTKRFSIIKYLSKSEDPIETGRIAAEIKSWSNTSTRTTVAEINARMKSILSDISEENFIVNQDGVGYLINPIYKNSIKFQA